MMNDLPRWISRLFRNANFGDGGDGGDGGGDTGGSSADAGSTGGGDGSATGGDASGGAGSSGGIGDAGAGGAGDAGGTGGIGDAAGTGGVGTSGTSETAGSGLAGGVGGFGLGGAGVGVGSAGGAPGSALGADASAPLGDPGDPFGSNPGDLGFTSLGGPNPMDPGSPGFDQPLSTQGDFLAGGVAPTDPGAFAGLGPGTIGSNPGFGFGPGDAPPGSLTFGDPTAVDPTADMAAQGWPVGTVGAPPTANQADLDQLANPGTGLPVGTPSVLDTSAQPSQADQNTIGPGGITFTGGGPGPTDGTIGTTDTQGGVSGGGTINPLGLGVLAAGAGSPLARGFTGSEGGVQLAGGNVVPEPTDVGTGASDVLSSDQIVQRQQQMDALLAQWAQIIDPSDPRWAQVLQLVQQQVQGQPIATAGTSPSDVAA